MGRYIHQPGLPALADVGELAQRDAQQVGGHRQGRAVEVAAGQDGEVLPLAYLAGPEDQGVVLRAVQLGPQYVIDIVHGVAGRAVHLGHAAQRVSVLHFAGPGLFEAVVGAIVPQ